jgi:hypothetical protein
MLPLILLMAGLMTTTPPVPPDGMARSAPRFVGAGVLRAHDSATHKVPIDFDAECVFLLTASGSELSIEARSPSGRVYSSRDTTVGAHTDMFSEFLGGALGMLHLEKPELGTWTVTVQAEDFPDSVNNEAYQLQVLQDATKGGPQLTLLLPDSTRHKGDPVIVRASLLEDGKPVPGARVQAAVGSDETPISPISLLDDGRPPDEAPGDGIFTGRIDRLFGSGFATAEVTASRRGAKGLPDFDREARTQFLIAASRSRLTGRIRDFPRDADGDGLNEEIVFAVGIEVTDPVSLKLMADVSDSKGKKVWSFGKDTQLERGTRELEFVCDTEELAKDNVPGPLVVDTLRLFESETYAELDRATPSYRTRAYTSTDFMHDAIRVEGTAIAHGVDLDKNGRFDAVDVELPVYIRYPGNYYSSSVLARGDTRFADADGRQDFVAGKNTIRLRFAASCFTGRSAEGRWNLDGIYVGYYHESGDTRPSPKYGYSVGTIWLEGMPPMDRFESGKPDSHCR